MSGKPMSEIRYDLCVVGAGSGGIGAALAAARMGLSVLLIEKSDTLGGNAVRGGVHNWEPGVGGTSFPFEIYQRLEKIPNGTPLRCATTGRTGVSRRRGFA
jgi:thioredoxin reductase